MSVMTPAAGAVSALTTISGYARKGAQRAAGAGGFDALTVPFPRR